MLSVRELVRPQPGVRQISLLRQRAAFNDSAHFWEENYAKGRTSGSGSYGALAEGKSAFLNHLYCGMDEPDMKTIDVIICRLRKKLATAGVPTLIDTVWGCGYILREPGVTPPMTTTDPVWSPRVAVAA